MPGDQITSGGRWTTWVAGLVVATGAGIATAHGMYQVAISARVAAPIACLYPLITDGLALVAYAATARLQDRERRYATGIVVLAAGLSGLAQAVYLSGGLDHTAVAPVGLRFGVGAWPAIAAALTAHLLYLLSPAARTRVRSGQRQESRSRSRATREAVPEQSRTAVPAQATGTPAPTPGRTLSLVPSGRTAEQVMREHWDRERAAGRTPSGAELDRVGGTKDGYGRKLARRWSADEPSAGEARR
jgi:hypothetical protein